MFAEISYRLGCRINRWIYGGRRARGRRRGRLAGRYLRGDGIEIGALQSPLPLPEEARARYVDRMTNADLRRQYPELESKELAEVDIVDDGEVLSTVDDGSADFVIANHLIEHCENPIAALGNWLRVLRKGGVVFLAVPDKRFTFDHCRPVTALDHLLRDWEEGPGWSRMRHYEEWAALVDKIPPARIEEHAQELASTGYSIHFHVWTPKAFTKLLELCLKKWNESFRIRDFIRNGKEMIAILERNG